VHIVIAGDAAEIAYLFEVVDQVFRVEVAEVDDHVHAGEVIDKRGRQFTDAVNVGISYYTYSHDLVLVT
jgi:hypothetical protein